MGKYDLALARKIIDGSANLTAKQEVKALAEISAARAEHLSPAATKANSTAHEILKSKDNVRLMGAAAKDAEFQKTKNIQDSQWAREKPMERTVETTGEKINKYNDDMAIEKQSREPVVEEQTRASDWKKVAAIAPAASTGFENPIDMIKSGYDKFENVRSGFVDKIMDLTGEPVNGNPYVPQYAKDHYNKAAEAILSNGTNPINYVGGAGAIDAGLGVAGTAYDIYKGSSKPVTSYVDRNPVQQFKIKP